jgi:hypothetical protein
MEQKQDRRGFLVTAGRYALAALLGGGVALLATRDRSKCTVPDACRGCGALERCDLPQAATARQENPRGGRNV